MFTGKLFRFFTSLILPVILLTVLMPVSAQVNPKDSLNISLINVGASVNLPAADLSKRFGFNGTISGGYSRLFMNRRMVEVTGDFIFGDKIKNKYSVLSLIANENGQVIDQEGTLKDVYIYERGYSLYFSAGKLFPRSSYNPNTGLLLMAGIGYLQHKYRFEIENNNAPQLEVSFKKGYDHLCGGPSLRQYVGYYHIGNSKKINYFIGVELKEAFTFSFRPYYINEMKYADEKRFDVMAGIKFGWILPLYKKSQSTYYYE